MTRLRHNREFLALWIGQTASALGTSISVLTLPLLVLTVSGSAAQAGLVASAGAAASFLIRIPAGLVVDRFDRRRLMQCCDAVRVVAVGSVASAVWWDAVRIPHLLLVAIVEGVAGSLFGPAETIAVRRVVAPERVQDAVAINESRRRLAALIGPSLGGVLFAAGRAWPFVADAISYVISFLAVGTVRTDLRPTVDKQIPPRGRRAELTEGLRWLWKVPLLRTVSIWLALAETLFTSTGLVTLVLARDLGASPQTIGIMFTVCGLGGLAGALAPPWILRRLRAGIVLIGYAWLASAAALALPAAQSVWVLGVLGAIAFFPVPAVNALLLSRVMTTVPDSLQGRTVSATNQLTGLAQPLGPVLAGALLDGLGPRPAVILYGALFVLLAAWATASSTIRRA